MRDEGLHQIYEAMGAAFADRAFNSTYNRLYDQSTVQGLLPQVEGNVVVDIGCGPGAYFDWLLERGAQRIIGFDASREMIRLAQKRYAGRVELRVHDFAEPLGFLEDGSIDVAICSLMIHYLRDPVPPLREIRRVLKPSGCLVVSTQHPTTDWLRKGGSYFETKLETDIWQDEDEEYEVRFWRVPLTALTEAFDEAGLVIDRLVEHQPGEQFEESDPAEQANLLQRPGFIAFRLRPRPGEWTFVP